LDHQIGLMAHTMHIDHKKTLTPSILNVINLDAYFLGKIIKEHHGINQNALQIIKSGPSITHYKDNNKSVCCQSSIT